MSVKSLIDSRNIPNHIAVIMDGNGRWAKQRNKPRVFGHRNGVKAVKNITEAAAELGVKYLTLFAFSKENWNRPSLEVNTLMNLFVKTVGRELSTLMENNIRLEAIGEIERLPKATFEALQYAKENTRHNDQMTLILALNYSGRWEIVEAVKKLSKSLSEGKITADEIDEKLFAGYLETASFPDPDLMIRTSGEFRLSNYMMWQLSYTELYFTEVLWPDFSKEHLYEAIYAYQSRERRFGMTSDQLMKS